MDKRNEKNKILMLLFCSVLFTICQELDLRKLSIQKGGGGDNHLRQQTAGKVNAMATSPL